MSLQYARTQFSYSIIIIIGPLDIWCIPIKVSRRRLSNISLSQRIQSSPPWVSRLDPSRSLLLDCPSTHPPWQALLLSSQPGPQRLVLVLVLLVLPTFQLKPWRQFYLHGPCAQLLFYPFPTSFHHGNRFYMLDTCRIESCRFYSRVRRWTTRVGRCDTKDSH